MREKNVQTFTPPSLWETGTIPLPSHSPVDKIRD